MARCWTPWRSRRTGLASEGSLPAVLKHIGMSQSRHVFHRHTRLDLPVAVRGEGIYLFDSEGKRYLDASGGAAVSCLGHGHPRVVAAIKRQLDEIAYAHTSFFTTEVAESLADTIIGDAPAGIERVYFNSGGSEGIEAALKMARQYFLEIGQPERGHIIGRWQSYHGNTLGALAAGGNRWRRQPFEPHEPHQPLHPFAIDHMSFATQPGRHASTAAERMSRVLAIDQRHQRQVLRGLARRLVVEARSAQTQQLALLAHAQHAVRRIDPRPQPVNRSWQLFF